MEGLSAQKVKQVYFLVALTLLGCLLAYFLKEYISSFLGAATIYILLRSPLHYLSVAKKWPKLLAVTLLMLLSVVMLILPLGLLSVMLSSKAQYLVEHYAYFLDIIRKWNQTISAQFNINLFSEDTLSKVTAAGANIIPEVLSATISSVAQISVLYFILYFMMAEGLFMETWVLKNIPFNNENTQLLVQELKVQTYSNAIGIPILIIIQAVIAAIGYAIFGMDEPIFWGIITGFASMIPIIGVAVIWIPVCIYLYFTSTPGRSIGLGIYNGLLLVNVEHLVRFSVLKRYGNTHPLVTFFGIIIGLSLFGFLGLIFGPLLISYFIILLQIYQREYMQTTEILQEIDETTATIQAED